MNFGPLQQAARTTVSALLGSARQIDLVFTAGSIENARSSLDERTRHREIQDALEDAWDGRDLGRTA